ncbi:unnamed protein product, partial [Prorocentrum cordatum]
MERGSGEPDEVLALRRILAVLAAEGAEGPDSESQAGAGEEPEEHRPLLYASLASLRDGFSGYCASAPQDFISGLGGRALAELAGEAGRGQRTLPRPPAASRAGLRRLGAAAAVGGGGGQGRGHLRAAASPAVHQYQDSRRVCEVCSH